MFGEVNYQRTYYKNKREGTYSYLSDELLGIESHARIDLSLQSELVGKALDISYEKSGKDIGKESEVSKQTVMNCIRRIGKVENSFAKLPCKKKKVEILYIETDEDHVAMQDGSNKEVKLVYVHEGKKQEGKDRYKLINCRYFTGTYKNSEELWLEVADYLEQAYDMEHVKKIYLPGYLPLINE